MQKKKYLGKNHLLNINKPNPSWNLKPLSLFKKKKVVGEEKDFTTHRTYTPEIWYRNQKKWWFATCISLKNMAMLLIYANFQGVIYERIPNIRLIYGAKGYHDLHVPRVSCGSSRFSTFSSGPENFASRSSFKLSTCSRTRVDHFSLGCGDGSSHL